MNVEKTIETNSDLLTEFRVAGDNRTIWLDFYQDKIVLNIGTEQVTFKAGAYADRQVVAINGFRE